MFWKPVTTAALVTVSICLSLLALVLLKTDGFIPVLDHTNLVFHEAGHPIFGLLGETMGLYGGTLGQLVFPIAIMIQFLRQGDSVGFTLGGAWFFQNWINIARYMADARAQILPFVGGGEHDWLNIFMRWGVLESDVRIAGLVKCLGWVGILSIWGWLIWKWKTNDQTTV